MPETSWLSVIGSIVLFIIIAAFFVRMIPRVMGKQCPNCLRRVPKGTLMCPACGTAVTARNDLGK